MSYENVVSTWFKRVIFLQVLLVAVCAKAADYTLQYSTSANVMSYTGLRADVSGITPLSYSGTVTIPNTYSKSSGTYVVMGIKESALKGSAITKLYIGENCYYIEYLGSCPSLQKIVIRNKYCGSDVASNAFIGTHADCLVYVPRNFSVGSTTLNPGDYLGGRKIEYFHYNVKFDANGGTGSMSNQKIYTDVATALSACNFTRSGYSFEGWATSATGAKVYNDKQKVTNLSTGINATVTLYAVWTALPTFPSGSITATSYSGKYDGSAHKISVSVGGGISGATVKYASSENGTYSTTCPTLTDVGTIKTWYEVSKSGYASKKGSASVTISKRNITLTSGTANKTYDGTALVKHEVVVSGDGFVSGQGASYSYSGTQTAAGSSDNTFTYVLNSNTKAGNYSIATVKGTLTVGVANIGDWNDGTKWNISLSGDGVKYDGTLKTCTVTALSYNNIAITTFSVSGNTAVDVGNYMLTITGLGNFTGTHNFPWSVAAGDVPFISEDEDTTIIGDYKDGYVLTPSSAQGNVVVVIPEWLDVSKVVVNVAPTVDTVVANGATVKIISRGSDITEHLDIPAAENGVIDIRKATVKESIIKEVLDTAREEVAIDLSPTAPSITTANTRPGLKYTFFEGRTIEELAPTDQYKWGDNAPFEPTPSIKGGASGFYTIKVEK